MDIYEVERCKTDILRTKGLTLMEDSINVIETSKRKLKIELRYAEKKIGVAIFLQKHLDFMMIDDKVNDDDDATNEAAQESYFDENKLPRDFDEISVVELLVWIVDQVKANERSKLKLHQNIGNLNTILTELVDSEIIAKTDFDIDVSDENVTLFLKFYPSSEIKLHNLFKSVIQDKLLKPTENYFILKLVIKTETLNMIPSEIKVKFSQSLIYSLPDLETMKLRNIEERISNKYLTEVISVLKDSVNEKILEAYQGWNLRASLLLTLQQAFQDSEVAITRLDTLAMTKIQLAFKLETVKNILNIELSFDHPMVPPKIIFFQQLIGDDEISKTSLTNKQTKMAPDMSNDEILEKIIKLVRIIHDTPQ